MTETINNLIDSAVKIEAIEALNVLSKLPTCDPDANREIATAVGRIMFNK